MRSIVLLAAAGGLVTLLACGSQAPATTGTGGGTSSSGTGTGGTMGVVSFTGGAGATTVSSSTTSSTSGATSTSAASSTGSFGVGGAGTGGAGASGSGGPPTCSGTESFCASGCTNLSTDSQNCGFCGHSCLSEVCLDGVCMSMSDPR